MKKVIELIRVSTEGHAADDRASIPAQRTVNRRTCAQHGLEIVGSIEISDVSGARVLFAPEIKRLVETMQSPDIHGVVTREFSRLMRPENFSDYALLQAFADTNTVLYLPDGPIDLGNKTGRLMGTIRAAIAGMERSEILERVWTAKEEKRRRGELAQSKIVLPWGVGYEPGRGFFYKPEADRMRDVFSSFLAGSQSYSELARFIGVTPRGMHLIMRNPIWMGWRIIDKKRDASSAGHYPGKDGRQVDRRKIARSPEEVIRVKVISEPLLSETEFENVQRLMDLKQEKHWRSQPHIEHRFIYNGFLMCAKCGELILTALARRDYYVCKGRRSNGVCTARYMAREKLESKLDVFFTEQLANRNFLEQCVRDLRTRDSREDTTAQTQRLAIQVARLREKRDRVLDTFLDGIIPREERDQRLLNIDREIQRLEGLLLQSSMDPKVDADRLGEAFSVLFEWKFWNREQKRSVLAALAPEIRVLDYDVMVLGISPAVFSNKVTRSPADFTMTAHANVSARHR
jgi:DNA invertase Pin-like site-specific DNA recombinase